MSVTVVIPTVNRVELLTRAINSVINQTYKDFEILVVDNWSTDGTPESVENFMKSDCRIKYYRTPYPTLTPTLSRNLAISKAKYPFIAFLDDDDEWMPKKLQLQLQEMTPDCGLSYTDVVKIRNGKIIGFVIDNQAKVNLNKANHIPLSAVLIRKECFDKHGLFNSALFPAEDWDMWLRIAPYYKFSCVSKLLVKYHKHSRNMSRDWLSMWRACRRVRREHKIRTKS